VSKQPLIKSARHAERYPGVTVEIEPVEPGIESTALAARLTIGAGVTTTVDVSSTALELSNFDLAEQAIEGTISALQAGAYTALGMSERYALLDGLLERVRETVLLNRSVSIDPATYEIVMNALERELRRG
jgi:hypothetical protein